MFNLIVQKKKVLGLSRFFFSWGFYHHAKKKVTRIKCDNSFDPTVFLKASFLMRKMHQNKLIPLWQIYKVPGTHFVKSFFFKRENVSEKKNFLFYILGKYFCSWHDDQAFSSDPMNRSTDQANSYNVQTTKKLLRWNFRNLKKLTVDPFCLFM